MTNDAWTREDFTRREYGIKQSEKKELDSARRISIKISIDGRTLFDLQMREPGLLAITSRPDDADGFTVDIVQRNSSPGMGARHTDYRLPDGSQTPAVEEWMFKLLGL